MQKLRYAPLLAVLLLCTNALLGQAPTFTEKVIKKHVGYLASDKLKGRGTGSKEELKAASYIAKQFKKAGIQPKGNDGTWFHNFTFRKSSDPHGMSHDGPTVSSRNVVGYLDNGSPYTIVIGAHYDHLGMGHDHNSLDANPEGKIHNGADDNASGTAGVIELARYYAQNGVKEQHNFLFICFSGEELGLLGSKKYTETPTIDLGTVSFMLNMDMIGRLNEEKRLVIGGVGTSPAFVPVINNLKTDVGIKKDSAGIGPSDHTSFYLKNIPVLFAFTGQHSDYHKPSDDTEKVNFTGEVKVLTLMATIINELDRVPKLVFQETKSKDTDTPRFKVTLGIMPDYTYEEKGVKVDGVTEGKPAHKAGLLKGDVIVGLGNMDVPDMASYMKALAAHKKGDKTKVKVQRGSDVKEFDVEF
jgi:hypothetical protein